MTSGSGVCPAPPAEARQLFGAALPLAEKYVNLLAIAGVERGLIGPREVPRLWERHAMNCAVVEELIPKGRRVVDLGSGAGLPGIVLAIVRPDVRMTLLEPLLRRTVFLEECVELLGLGNVEVLRGRAEEMSGKLHADVVTARAVAPLPRLAGWGLPLLRPEGALLALKGEQAEAELRVAAPDLSKIRPCVSDVIRVGTGKVEPATTVVRIKVIGGNPAGARVKRAPGGRKKRGRKR